jgi:heat-inducible transcriptional repressor
MSLGDTVMDKDENSLPELTARQEEILALIVKAYTQTPEPVSSRYLVEHFQLPMSSATIRNEMAALEDMGYITHPHTSAGRVPTETGYRYVVRGLLETNPRDALSSAEETRITERLQRQPLATEGWLNQAATMLARTAQGAALVTPPAAETSRFKHIELIAIQGRLALMVLVLNQGAVYQQMLTLPEPLAQERLREAANRLNTLCTDLSAKEVGVRAKALPLLEREFAEVAADLMAGADHDQVRVVYGDGLSDVIASFPHGEAARQAVRVFQERAVLNMILSEVLASPAARPGSTPELRGAPGERTAPGVRVVIAGNGRWEELSHLSMVLSRYGVPGEASGAVGIVGPTHINYSRAIGAVNLIASVMTQMLTSALHVPAAPDEDARPAGDGEA